MNTAVNPCAVLFSESEQKEIDVFVADINAELSKMKRRGPSRASMQLQGIDSSIKIELLYKPSPNVARGICLQFHHAGWVYAETRAEIRTEPYIHVWDHPKTEVEPQKPPKEVLLLYYDMDTYLRSAKNRIF